MSTADEYRRYAAECMALAERLTDLLTNPAFKWRKLFWTSPRGETASSLKSSKWSIFAQMADRSAAKLSSNQPITITGVTTDGKLHAFRALFDRSSRGTRSFRVIRFGSRCRMQIKSVGARTYQFHRSAQQLAGLPRPLSASSGLALIIRSRRRRGRVAARPANDLNRHRQLDSQ